MKGGTKLEKLTLKAYRVNAGFTQEQASKLIGVSIKCLSMWETDKDALKGARLESVKKMCEVYGIEITDLDI